MTDKFVIGDTDLLRQLCAEYDLPYQLLVDLLKIQQEHQFQERRHGINDQLRDCIVSSIQHDKEVYGAKC